MLSKGKITIYCKCITKTFRTIQQINHEATTPTAKKTSLENKHLGNGDYFVIIASSSHPLLLTEHDANGPGRSAVEVNIENERLIVGYSRCR